MLLKLRYNAPLSNVAFKFNLRRFNTAGRGEYDLGLGRDVAAPDPAYALAEATTLMKRVAVVSDGRTTVHWGDRPSPSAGGWSRAQRGGGSGVGDLAYSDDDDDYHNPRLEKHRSRRGSGGDGGGGGDGGVGQAVWGSQSHNLADTPGKRRIAVVQKSLRDSVAASKQRAAVVGYSSLPLSESRGLRALKGYGGWGLAEIAQKVLQHMCQPSFYELYATL